MYRSFLTDARKLNTCLRLVGLTATPYRTTTGPLCGDDQLLKAVCFDVPVMSLIDQGYLSKLTSKRVTECDTSKLHIRGGEFVAEEVSLLMGATDAVKLACEEIIARTQDRKSVLIFCSGVEHAMSVRDLLPSAELITGETRSREEILDRFKNCVTKYLVNVNVLTTGFDAPNVDCVVMLRPTLSPGLYVQMCGRGFRLHESKKDCLILDFGGNIQRHGPINRIRVEKKRKGKPTGEAATRVCPDCDEVLYVYEKTCSACGYEWPVNEEAKHGHQSGSDDIIGDDDAIEFPVFDVRYRKHFKKNGTPDDPPTLRVEYITRAGGMVSSWMKNSVISEWVCVEHQGFARNKAALWWAARSNDPMPATVDRAIDIAEGGGLAVPSKVWTQADPQNPKYTRITKVELGPKPEAAPLCGFCGGVGCEECKFEFADVAPESVFSVEECPF
jgi:DNA repair protein RadD